MGAPLDICYIIKDKIRIKTNVYMYDEAGGAYQKIPFQPIHTQRFLRNVSPATLILNHAILND